MIKGRNTRQCRLKVAHCLLALNLATVLNVASAQQRETVSNYVDPLVGTANSTTASALKHGEGGEQLANTIPAVGLPFGMTQWSAQSRAAEKKCQPPYLYKDSLLSGFRGTHWLSGSCTQDYGSLTIMPLTGRLKLDLAEYATTYSHASEVAAPDYYKVTLPAYGITTEMTATARCGMLRFLADRDDSLYLLIMPNSDKARGFVRIDRTTGEISGYNPAYRIYQGAGKPAGFSGYFVIRFQRIMASGAVFAEGRMEKGDSLKERKDLGAFAGFYMRRGERLIIRVGTSFTSIAAARKNLEAEMPDWDFEAIRKAAGQVWEKALAKIRVEGEVKDKKVFYTAMYHTMQLPRLFNDVDGSYPQFSKQYELATLSGGRRYYDDFSMWDIYRAELPLYEILDTALINDLAGSIINKGRQGGWVPIFPCWNSYTNEMIGDHSTVFIASAYLKNIRGYDVGEAYRLMRQNAFDSPDTADYQDGKGRRALQSYNQYGYIPLEDPVKYAFHNNEQVSRTLEYAYDDYALAMVARAMNKEADHRFLLARSRSYRNVFDDSTKMVRGRYADGHWIYPFNADMRASYITEGTPRQYTFYVPQDIPGLTRLMGGKEQLEKSLDSLFIRGEYWHGNEPGHQIPFMYNFTAAPWKTQRIVRNILAEEYTDGPGGLSGNDDAGQISAWYVFGALGLYPVDPVSGKFQLCSPLFGKASLQLPGGKTFRIITHKSSADAIYIGSILLNGKKLNGLELSYDQIMRGGVLEVNLIER